MSSSFFWPGALASDGLTEFGIMVLRLSFPSDDIGTVRPLNTCGTSVLEMAVRPLIVTTTPSLRVSLVDPKEFGIREYLRVYCKGL